MLGDANQQPMMVVLSTITNLNHYLLLIMSDLLSQLLATQMKSVEQQQAEIAQTQKYFEQDGIVFTVFKGKNAPFRNGFFRTNVRFDQIRLPEGHSLHRFAGRTITSWLYQAEDFVADTETPSFKFKLFIPASQIEQGFVQMIDIIVNNGEFNGRQFKNKVTGEEVSVRRNENPPNGSEWQSKQEFVASLDFNKRGMLGAIQSFNPQQESAVDLNEVQEDTFNELLANKQQADKKNLDFWRVNRDVAADTLSANPSVSDASSALSTKESQPAAPSARGRKVAPKA